MVVASVLVFVMAGLFNQVVSMGKAALQRIGQGPSDPNVVRPVSPADLARVPTVEREGCLQLVGPRPGASVATSPTGQGPSVAAVVYEVVAHTEKGQSFRYRNAIFV